MQNGLKLYLVRHGESANNALPDAQRVNDPLLTERGQQQAQLLGERFHQKATGELEPDLLLTSAFTRTIQTLRPMATLLAKKPQIWTELYEVGGCYDGHLPGQMIGAPGLSRSQLQERYPEYIIPDDIDDNGWFRLENAETHAQAAVRAEQQAERLLETFYGQDIVVLCLIHADFKNLLLQQFLPDQERLQLANTSVTLLHFEEKVPSVVAINDTQHLSAELISY
ncbi:hypothetical protein AB833_15865 [Chromatiales bacterium (ex Bugula neritina AB1)]|nr:hypothetical protein AB833_15865 [Chromatiales bacterium (ex Bugula neritina AB1)]